MKVLYFAWLKVKIGAAAEEIAPPATVTTVAQLLAWLRTRGPGHAAALADLSALRVAVNQEYAKLGDPVRPGDEVALFPPVTGG